jgi:hypothetical protein
MTTGRINQITILLAERDPQLRVGRRIRPSVPTLEDIYEISSVKTPVCRQLFLAVKLGSDLATHPYSPL